MIHAESRIHQAGIGPIEPTTALIKGGAMNPIGISDAKVCFSRLLRRAAMGEDTIIARSGRPVVRIVAVKPTGQRNLSIDADKFTVPQNFNDPTTEDRLEALRISAGCDGGE